MFFLVDERETEKFQNDFKCIICFEQKTEGFEIENDIFPFCQILFSKKIEKEEGKICQNCVSNFTPNFFQQRIEDLKNKKEKSFNFDERIESLSYEGMKNILKECLKESFASDVSYFIQNEFKNEVLRFQETKIQLFFNENFLILENFLKFKQEDYLIFLNFLSDEIWKNIHQILDVIKLYKKNITKTFEILTLIFKNISNLNKIIFEKQKYLEMNFWISNGINYKKELLKSIYFLLNSMLKKNEISFNLKIFNLLLEYDDFYILREFLNNYETLRTFKLFYHHVLIENFKKTQNFLIYKLLIETTIKKLEIKRILIPNIKEKDLLFQILIDENDEKKIEIILKEENLQTITKFTKPISHLYPIFIYKNGTNIITSILLKSIIQKINSKELMFTQQDNEIDLFLEWFNFIKISCGITKIPLENCIILKNGQQLFNSFIKILKNEIQTNLNKENYEEFKNSSIYQMKLKSSIEEIQRIEI